MIRTRDASSNVTTLVLGFALALACVASTGCKKDAKDDGDAAADAAADAAVADAGAVVADAAVDAADAAVAPLVTATAAPKPVVAPKPDPPICAAARSAKARNSPAAPGLAKQCAAAGGTL